jgi:hypothetical protein
MKRWYVSLPKYAKEMKKAPDGKLIDKGYSGYINLLSQNPSGHVFLFEKLPQVFGYSEFVVGVTDNISGAKIFFDDAIIRLREYLCDRVKQIFASTTDRKKLHQMSLTSVIKEWCESLDPKVFEQIFTDGTDKCLSLFRTISNDEISFIARLAKATTDLRLEDWNNQTIEKCLESLNRYKNTAEDFQFEAKVLNIENQTNDKDTYQITFSSINGDSEIRRFSRVSTSRRAQLLYNKILADIDSFGQAVTEAEKRQILMEVLRELC